MAGLISDALLGLLVRRGPAPVARWAARKAAMRGMHWVALRAGMRDPYVLSLLGLYDLAASCPATDRRAVFGHRLAHAALEGRADPDRDAGMNFRDRVRLASALAPSTPGKAAELLPEDDFRAIAACYLAAGEIEVAEDLLGASHADRETALLAAHIALRRERFGAGRSAWNAAFAADGLSAPLDGGAGPVTPEDFRTAPIEGVEGPKVSVVVPFRDAEATLQHAIGSLAGQSWRNLEILAVDDASRDDSADIVRRLADRDSRIQRVQNRRAPGVYGARNTALEVASGDYVTFLDADDWSPPERIARQMQAVHDGAAVSIANHVRIDAQGLPVAPRIFPLARPVPITMLLPSMLFARVGLFDEVETGADSEMLGRLQATLGRRAIARESAILLVARWRDGSLSEAREGGLFGRQRLAYRAEWMFRHAGIEPPLASTSGTRQDEAELRRRDD